jgi:hypothetical protein
MGTPERHGKNLALDGSKALGEGERDEKVDKPSTTSLKGLERRLLSGRRMLII